MKVGDLVRGGVWGGPVVAGVVLAVWAPEEPPAVVVAGSYLYSVHLLESGGRVVVYDVHDGDRWEVLSEAR